MEEKTSIEKVGVKLADGSGQLLARASVRFTNGLLVRNFRISNSKFTSEPWVQPPKHKINQNGKWVSDIFAEKALWKNIQEAIMEEYQREVVKQEQEVTDEQIDRIFPK